MENKEKFLREIGNNIQKIREEKRIERKVVAKSLDITVQAFGEIENGHVDLNISRLFEIAQYLKVPFSQILNYSGDVLNFTSQNNSGGYHVQKVGVINASDETFLASLKNDLEIIKMKVDDFGKSSILI